MGRHPSNAAIFACCKGLVLGVVSASHFLGTLGAALLCEWSINCLQQLLGVLAQSRVYPPLFSHFNLFSQLTLLPHNCLISRACYFDFVMADKNNKKATPLSGDKREPPHIKDYNQKWDSIKLDVFEIYIQQNKSLKATRTAILGSHGFESWSVKNLRHQYKG